MPSVDRTQVTLHRSPAKADDGGYMPGTAEDRILQVWELTRESWAFFRAGDAERPLQRDVVVLVRGDRQVPLVAITNKRATGRTQDLADAERLESIRHSE
jgi:hypothetical protein